MSFRPKNAPEGLDEVGELLGALSHDLMVGALALQAPAPRILERLDLGGGLLATSFLEEDVIGGVGVEGRVEVDEVYGLVGDMFPEDVEVVPEVELVLPVGLFIH